MEVRIRSAVKSILWRIMGIVILGTVTYFYTRHWVQTSLITFLHHGVFLFVFYLKERFWLHVDYKPPFHSLFNRSIFKMICYETILGTFILGIITLALTGNIQKMSQITFTYIFIKHFCYVVNELCWKKIKWGKSA